MRSTMVHLKSGMLVKRAWHMAYGSMGSAKSSPIFEDAFSYKKTSSAVLHSRVLDMNSASMVLDQFILTRQPS